MQSKSTESRYGSVAIAIHWISALLVLVLIGSGFRSGFSADPATKTAVLQVHLPVAILVLLLTLGRLIWWWRFDTKPGTVEGVPHWQELAAKLTHGALYLLILVLLASGITMSVMSGLPDALFGSAELPKLAELAPRAGHGIAARILAGVIVLHACAALYHHWVLKDRTLRRMWFGKE